MPRPELEIIIFMGIQASGKSTFYTRAFFSTHMRISLDMLNTRPREKRLIEACLEVGQSLVIDNTSPFRTDREKFIAIAKNYKARVRGYYFQPNLENSIERNAKRDGLSKVPACAIISRYNNIELPKFEEGFDNLFLVKSEGGEFLIEDYIEDEFQTIDSRKAQSRYICINFFQYKVSPGVLYGILYAFAIELDLTVSYYDVDEDKGHLCLEVVGLSGEILDTFVSKVWGRIEQKMPPEIKNDMINGTIRVSSYKPLRDDIESFLRSAAMNFSTLHDIQIVKIPKGFFGRNKSVFMYVIGLENDLEGLKQRLDKELKGCSIITSF